MLRVDHIENSIFNSITWILSDSDSDYVWLVDCGDVAPALELIGKREIVGVLLTHAHFDHIYGLPELLKRFPNSKIYTNESGRETLANAKKNMSFYHESPVTVEEPCSTFCDEGDTITLFPDTTAIVYSTPGHHPSCLTFMVGDYLFTGDAYIPGVKVVTNLPGGNKKQAQESLERILQLTFEKIVCSGHSWV